MIILFDRNRSESNFDADIVKTVRKMSQNLEILTYMVLITYKWLANNGI